MSRADALSLSLPEFVGWLRSRALRLPFPLNVGENEFVRAPEPAELAKTWRARDLTDDPILAETARVYAAPRLILYAQRSYGDHGDERQVAIAAHGPSAPAVFATLSGDRLVLRVVPETSMAATVVTALPPVSAAPVAPAELPMAAVLAAEDAIAAGQPARPALERAGYPPELAAFRDKCGDDRSGAIGGLGAVLAAPGEHYGRQAGQGVIWREYPAGALVFAQQRARRGEPTMVVGPADAPALFRELLSLVDELYDRPVRAAG